MKTPSNIKKIEKLIELENEIEELQDYELTEKYHLIQDYEIDEMKDIKFSNIKYEFRNKGIFEPSERSYILKNLIEKTLSEPERIILYMYASVGSLRKVAIKLGISTSSTHKMICNIRSKLYTAYGIKDFKKLRRYKN